MKASQKAALDGFLADNPELEQLSAQLATFNVFLGVGPGHLSRYWFRTKGEDKNVDIRIPLSLVKGGMRLGAMIPGCGEAVTEKLKKQGINFDVTKLDPEQLEAALHELGEMDIDDGKSHVRISYE